MDLATGSTTRLTQGEYTASADREYIDLCPSWSPDRKSIVFASNRGGKDNYDLFVINADGTGLRQLTDTPEDEFDPVWSPDGRYIAYKVEVSPHPPQWARESRLFLISPDGGEVHQLTQGPRDLLPDWSPDGQYLAFWREEPKEDRGVYLWVVKTGSFVRLEFPKETPMMGVLVEHGYPRWLPRHGNLLSVFRCEEYSDMIVRCVIAIFEVEERKGEIVLHRIPALIETDFINYTWGPGGEWLIAPVRTGRGERRNLFRVRVSLTEESRACSGCIGVVDEKFLTFGEYWDDFPDWAPEVAPGPSLGVHYGPAVFSLEHKYGYPP